MIRLDRAGDTIVEVLIAVGLLGVVIVGAFITSNLSTKSSQQSKERSTALKIAQGQVELLKTLSANPASKLFNPPSPATAFCLNSGVATNYYVTNAAVLSGTPVALVNGLPALNSANDNNTSLQYDVSCKVTNGIQYNLAIDMPVAPANNYYNFQVHVRWDSIIDKGHDEVELVYKVGKPL